MATIENSENKSWNCCFFVIFFFWLIFRMIFKIIKINFTFSFSSFLLLICSWKKKTKLKFICASLPLVIGKLCRNLGIVFVYSFTFTHFMISTQLELFLFRIVEIKKLLHFRFYLQQQAFDFFSLVFIFPNLILLLLRFLSPELKYFHIIFFSCVFLFVKKLIKYFFRFFFSKRYKASQASKK